MIGVAGRDDLASMQRWVTEFSVDGFDHIVDVEGDVWREFGITTQPAFAFIDDDGTIETRLGAMGVDGLTERINTLLAG